MFRIWTQVTNFIFYDNNCYTKSTSIWRKKNISFRTKLQLLHILVLSIFLYTYKCWTLTAELQRRVQVMEVRVFRKFLGIAYKNHIIKKSRKPSSSMLVGIKKTSDHSGKKKKRRWYSHVTKSGGLFKTIFLETAQGKKRLGKQPKKKKKNGQTTSLSGQREALSELRPYPTTARNGISNTFSIHNQAKFQDQRYIITLYQSWNVNNF